MMPAKVKESLLYPLLQSVAPAAWSKVLGFKLLAVEDTAMQGGRPTGGRWTRPDLVTVGLASYEFVPGMAIDVSSIEVKSFVSIDLAAVYEALAHRRAATRAWVFFYVPQHLRNHVSKNLSEVCDVASEHGVGVVTFSNPADSSTWHVERAPVRVHTDPGMLDEFIRVQLSERTKSLVKDGVAKYARYGAAASVEVTIPPDQP
ncbi:MAG: hypothetical protein WBA00_13430 [Rhodococcus sp. (in: high G+C Gram-positive bacteria)]